MLHLNTIARRLYRVFLYTLAITVVTTAVMLSVARLLLPELSGYRQHIEAELGKFLEHRVTIDNMDARLIGLTPTLIFRNVHMLDKDSGREIIAFREAQLGIAFLDSIRQRSVVPSDFTIVGTVISIVRDRKGRFSIQGVDVDQLEAQDAESKSDNTELAGWLFKRSNISLQDSTIIWKQKGKGGKHWRFEHVNVSLLNDGEHHQLNCNIKLPDKLGKSLELALDVKGDLLDPVKWQGDFYIKGEAVQFTNLGVLPPFKNIKLTSGIADYTVWGAWQQGAITDISGNVGLYGIGLSKSTGENTGKNKSGQQKVKRLQFDILKGSFAWRGQADNWRFDIAGLEYVLAGTARPVTGLNLAWQEKKEHGEKQMDLHMEHVELKDVKDVLLFTGLLDKKQKQALTKLAPAGELEDISFYLNTKDKQSPDFRMQASARNLQVSAWDDIPGVSGVSGLLEMSEQNGRFKLNSQHFHVNAPKIMRNKIELTQIDGELSWHRLENSWQINAQDMQIKNHELDARADITVTTYQSKQPVHLDIRVGLGRVPANRASFYYPVGIIPKGLLAWLDQAFRGGDVAKMGFVFHGSIDSLPFRRGKGVLQAHIEGKGVQLAFHDDWPQMHSADVNVVISDTSVRIKQATGKLYDSDARHVDVTIRDFSRPVVELSGKVLGSLADAARFLTSTPIAPGAKQVVQSSRMLGNIETDVKVRIPLNDKMAKTRPLRFSGKVALQNNHFYMSKDTIDVTNLNGQVTFSDKKLSSRWLKATVLGNHGRLKLRSSKPEGKFVISVDGKGRNSGAGLYKRFALPGMQRIKGRIPWTASLTLAHQLKGKEQPARLQIKSNLEKVVVDLPEPFRKTRENYRDFNLEILFPGKNILETMAQYGDRAAVHLETDISFRPARILRGELHLAAGVPALPANNELRVTGVMNKLAYPEWTKVFQEHLALHKKKGRDPILYIPVIFDMGYLAIPLPDENDKSKSKIDLTRGGLDPYILPVIRGKIDRFVMDGIELGKFEFQSSKQAYGLLFDKFKLQAGSFSMEGQSNWQYKHGLHTTTFKADLKIPDLGNMLKAFKYKAIIEKGGGWSHFDLKWKGPPYGFRFANLNGKMNFHVKDGSITKVDPGAGRLLGLLSLSALPRRLLLDFRDMGDGMSFDDMRGAFRIRNGDADTRDLKIEGPLADVVIVGRTGLHKKDFDQIVTVTPQASGTLPVVGGLLGGTQVGAIVLLFERIFGSDVDKSLATQYRISGSWKKPQIEQINKPKPANEDAVGWIPENTISLAN